MSLVHTTELSKSTDICGSTKRMALLRVRSKSKARSNSFTSASLLTTVTQSLQGSEATFVHANYIGCLASLLLVSNVSKVGTDHGRIALVVDSWVKPEICTSTILVSNSTNPCCNSDRTRNVSRKSSVHDPRFMMNLAAQ